MLPFTRKRQSANIAQECFDWIRLFLQIKLKFAVLEYVDAKHYHNNTQFKLDLERCQLGFDSNCFIYTMMANAKI